jgi:hypothetical protein
LTYSGAGCLILNLLAGGLARCQKAEKATKSLVEQAHGQGGAKTFKQFGVKDKRLPGAKPAESEKRLQQCLAVSRLGYAFYTRKRA